MVTTDARRSDGKYRFAASHFGMVAAADEVHSAQPGTGGWAALGGPQVTP